MASNVPQCEPCAEDSTFVEAASWCSECLQWLCGNCSRYHQRLATTKNHTLLSQDEYKKVPKFASEINQKCSKHPDNELEYYCNNHIAVVCFICMKNEHSMCKNIKKLKDVVRGVKSSSAVTDIVSRLEYSISTMEKFVADRKKNTDDLMTTKNLMDLKIQALLHEHEKYLKFLSSSLRADLSKTCTEQISELEREGNNLKLKKDDFQEKLTEFQNMIKYASEIQMFLSLEMVNKYISDQEKYLQSIDRRILTRFLDLNFDANASKLKELVSSYGNVSVRSTKCPIQISGQNRAMVPMPVSKEVPKTEKSIAASASLEPYVFVRKFDIPQSKTGSKKATIRDMKCLSNGYLAMTDTENNRVVFTDQDGNMMMQEYLSSSPKCLTLTDRGQVAVTLYDEKKVIVWNPYQPFKKESIEVEDNCTGIEAVGDELIINCQRRGLLLYNLVSGSKRRLPDYTGNFDLCVSGSQGTDVYFYKHKTNDLVMINLKSGKENWRMKVYSKQPSCIAKDNSDHVYIVDSYNSVRKINSLNKNIEIVLKESSGICDPRAVAFFEKRDSTTPLFRRAATHFYLYVANNAGNSIIVFGSK